MKKRTRFFSVIATLTIAMGTLTACGDADFDSMTYDEIVDYADDYGIEVTIEPTEDVVIHRDETVKDEGLVEDEVVVEDKTVVEDETADEAEPVKTEAPKTDTNGSKTNGSTNDGSKTNGSTNSGISSDSTTNKPADPTPTSYPAPAPTPTPTHTHNWKEHTVTEQVWVPNIVVVDDYEEQVVGHVDSVAICNCGYTTTNRDDIVNHIKNHGFAGENTQFTIQPGYDVVEVIKVGSHEEDYGHNETQTYVDYYYCDCGERK